MNVQEIGESLCNALAKATSAEASGGCAVRKGPKVVALDLDALVWTCFDLRSPLAPALLLRDPGAVIDYLIEAS